MNNFDELVGRYNKEFGKVCWVDFSIFPEVTLDGQFTREQLLRIIKIMDELEKLRSGKSI